MFQAMDNPSHTDTRTRILTEAERLFRHYGYGKTTIADISEACGMSSANVYRFFPSKSALMEAICGRLITALHVRLHEITRMPLPASDRLGLFVGEMYQNTLENLLDHRKVHEMVVVAMDEQWLAIRTHLDRITDLLGALIEDGIASGEFPPKDVKRMAKTAHAAMVCFCHPVVVAQKLDDEERATPEEIAAFIVSALKSK
jgi:AcrR family transcriptional regulator